MSIRCKAAVCWKAKEPITIEEVEVAPPKAHEVRVRLTAAHICHTDSLVLEGLDSEGVYPVILGHEGAGIVESVGEGVTSCKVGDHVIPCYIPECGACKFCLSGKTNLCQKIRITQGKGLMPDGTTRFTCKGQSVFHFMGCSTFSEYTVLADISVAVIRRDVPLDMVGLLGCGITTGFGAATKTAKVGKGAVCGIWGLGGVGASVAQGCKLAGASRIIGIDMNPDKFAFAMQMGCTECINPKDHAGKNFVEVLTGLTDGGFDFTFECIGNVNTMRQALEACHKGWGESIIIGVAAAGTEIATRPFQLVTGRVWRGSAFGGVKGPSELPKIVDLYAEGKLKVDEYVTFKLPLEHVNEGFQLMHDGKSIRSSLYFGPVPK